MVGRALVAVFLGFFLCAPSLFATEGVVIEPSIQKIYLDQQGVPKESVKKVVIKNTTGLELGFTLRAIEFTNIDKSGGNVFLGQSLSEGEFATASWIEIPETLIFLIPGEAKEISFQLRNPENLLPGAHYGAILFETVRPEEGETDPSRVYLRQIASSLLYVSKESGNEQKVSVRNITRYHAFPKLVESLVVTFANEGESFVEPRGFVEVKNVFGWSVGRGILNESGKMLFSGQEREIEAHFKRIQYFFPGPYTFDVYHRLGEEEYQKVSRTFWYWEPIILGIGAFGLLGIIWSAHHWRRRYLQKKKGA